MTNNCPRRSPLPLDSFKRSSPGVMVPEYTRKYDNSPTCSSETVLKTKKDGSFAALGSTSISFLSVVFVAFSAPRYFGDGPYVSMKLIKGPTPMPKVAAVQYMGNIFRVSSATRKPDSRSASFNEPSSKNLFINASSVSAIFSMSSSWSCSAFCCRSVGISSSINFPFPSRLNFNSFILSTSTTVSNERPWFTGNCTRTTSFPNRSFAVATARSNSAFSVSNLFTTSMAGSLSAFV